MMEFKQDDVVSTSVTRQSHDGETTIGAGSMGRVTVVDVDLDGTTEGVEVLFEGKTYGHYYPRELMLLPGNPPIHDLKNKHPQFDAGVTITAENVVDVAEWCDARIVSPWNNPRLHVTTGFDQSPPMTVEVRIGDRMEKTEDGKFQVWINPTAPGAEDRMEDRPEMLKTKGFDPQAEALALVNALYYGEKSEIPLPVEEMYIVWFVNVLKNWKALVSSNAKDNRYYEVTYNGEKNEIYVDEYSKKSNVKYDRNNGMYDVTLITNDKI